MAYMEHGDRPLLQLPALNESGAAIEANRFVKRSGAKDYQVVKTAATTDPILGVVNAAIPDLARGSVIIYGVVNVTCAEAIAVGDKVGCDNAGKATVWTAAGGEAFAGVALTATTVADQLVLLALTGPGSYGIS